MKRVVSVTCPHCSTRYDFSIELQRLKSMGLQAKCTRCDGSFDIIARLREQLARGAPQNVARIRPVQRTATSVGAREFAMSKDEVDIESLNEDDLLELDGEAEGTSSDSKSAPPPPPPLRDDGPPDLLALAIDEAPPRTVRRSNPRRFSGVASVASSPSDEPEREPEAGVELSAAEMNALLEMARSLELSDEDGPASPDFGPAEDAPASDADLDAAFDRVASDVQSESTEPASAELPSIDDDLPAPDPEPGTIDLPEPSPVEAEQAWPAAPASEPDAPVERAAESSDAAVMLAPDVDPSLPLELDDGPAIESSSDPVMQRMSNPDSGPLSLLDLELPNARLSPLASMVSPHGIDDSRMEMLPRAPTPTPTPVAEEPWPPSAPTSFSDIDPEALFDDSAPDPEVPVSTVRTASGPLESEPTREPTFVLPTEPHWLDLALPPFAANDLEESPGEPALVWLLREGA